MSTKKDGKATGAKVEKKTTNGRQTVAKKPTKAKEAGYKDHKPGSRKGEVHKVYDEKGKDDAVKAGLEMGLKVSTLKSWIGAWARAGKAKAA